MNSAELCGPILKCFDRLLCISWITIWTASVVSFTMRSPHDRDAAGSRSAATICKSNRQIPSQRIRRRIQMLKDRSSETILQHKNHVEVGVSQESYSTKPIDQTTKTAQRHSFRSDLLNMRSFSCWRVLTASASAVVLTALFRTVHAIPSMRIGLHITTISRIRESTFEPVNAFFDIGQTSCHASAASPGQFARRSAMFETVVTIRRVSPPAACSRHSPLPYSIHGC